MADLLSFFQLMNVLERRKKKEEEEEEARPLQPTFFSLRWKEERRKRRAPWLLFPFFLLAAEPREGEGGHVMERRGIPIFIRSAPKSPPFITSRAPTS